MLLPTGKAKGRFRTRKKDYAVPRCSGLACHDAGPIKLADLQVRLNERFLYEYDLGSGEQRNVMPSSALRS